MNGRKQKLFTPYSLLSTFHGQFELRAREIVDGVISGIHDSSHHGFSLEFTDRRNYVPGDDPRQIDYKAYARTDRLEIKRSESEANRQTHLLLDCSGSMGCRYTTDIPGNFTKFEYGCFLVTVFAFLSLRQGDPVSVTLFDSQTRLVVPPKSSPEHFSYIAQKLERFELRSGEATNLDSVLDLCVRHLKKRALIILVSDLYCDPEGVTRRLTFLGKKHELIVFHLFDREELDFPCERFTEFRDVETGEKIPIDPNRIRNAYTEELHAFIEDYRKNCYRAGIEYHQVDTLIPLEKTFVDFFAQHIGK